MGFILICKTLDYLLHIEKVERESDSWPIPAAQHNISLLTTNKKSKKSERSLGLSDLDKTLWDLNFIFFFFLKT